MVELRLICGWFLVDLRLKFSTVEIWLNYGWNEVDGWFIFGWYEVEISTLKDRWNLVEIWLIFGWFLVEKLIFGWFLVEFWLRSWILVDDCFKINDFSTKYQRWGWLRMVEAQRWINVDSTLRGWFVPTGRPPFWQINHANSAYFRLFLGYFGVISATRPPLLDLGPLFTYPGSAPELVKKKVVKLLNVEAPASSVGIPLVYLCICDVAHQKGGFVAVGLLRYRWKHCMLWTTPLNYTHPLWKILRNMFYGGVWIPSR